MLRGFYTAASGILQQERTIAVLSNNLVNANTPGYRASRVVSTTFEHEFITRIENNNTQQIGKAAPIRLVSDVPVRFDSSSLEESGRPFDVAINGEGFFVVESTDESGGRYLTRNGNFDIDDEGYLVLRGTGRVMGQNGPIQLPGSNFTVGPNGTIYDDFTGYEIDTLSLVLPGEDVRLKLTRDGVYTADDIEGLPQMEAPQVIQGYTERSNIDLTQEYTMVMEAQRAFQACSTALQIIDRLNQKAAAQIASI